MAKIMGRPTIFVGRKTKHVHGRITEPGDVKFEEARARLAKLVGLPVGKVSDGNTVEFLSRGEKATRAYLKTRKGR